jgi:CO/xanthine dehydrogenase Mo-binding subunit
MPAKPRPRAQVKVFELPAIITIEQALDAGSFVLPTKTVTRGDAAGAIAAAPHRLSGRTRTGQQEQFYLEGHITYAVPREDGQLTLYTSSQHPEGNQREAAAALNLSTKDVEAICRRMGGAFGGKEGNASIFSQSAALAAFKLKRPVKLRVNRDDDMMITGKRHDFRADYEVGFDDSGRILGLDVTLASALRPQHRLFRAGERPRHAAHRQLLPPAAPAPGEPPLPHAHAVQHGLSRLWRAAGHVCGGDRHRCHRPPPGQGPPGCAAPEPLQRARARR